MRFRRVHAALPIAAAATLVATVPANATLPKSVTPVTVTLGQTSSGVNAVLQNGGSVAGTVTAASGGAPLQGGSVWLFRSGNATYINAGDTDASGNYQVGSLPGGTYAVCVSPPAPGTTTGWLGRCSGNTGFHSPNILPPASAYVVSVTAGHATSNINLALPAAAAIKGTVTDKPGDPMTYAYVRITDRKTGSSLSTVTDGTGHYELAGLAKAGDGYAVCVLPNANLPTTNNTGWLPRCYDGVPWDGIGKFAKNATPVDVRLGHVHSNVDMVLPAAGAVAGVVKDDSGTPLKYMSVAAYTTAGKRLGGASTDTAGHYRIKDLPAEDVLVCVYQSSPSPTFLYQGQCWKNATWNGGKLPAGATSVTVTRGQTRSGIGLVMVRKTLLLASISGRVTTPGGTPIEGANVDLYRAGANGTTEITQTDSTGHYTLANIHPADDWVVCVDPRGALSKPPAGWQGRCTGDVHWNLYGIPSSAATIKLVGGQDKTGLGFKLPLAGALTGTVTGDGGPQDSVFVYVYTAKGQLLRTADTDPSGNYTITSLLKGDYYVCFTDKLAPTPGFVSQCYDGVSWKV